MSRSIQSTARTPEARDAPDDLDAKKRATTDHEVLDVIAARWSPRAFQDRPVESEKVLRCLEAARWAPSCYNEQPWRFMVATPDDGPGFQRMLACLLEGNRKWAGEAPVLMLTFAKRTFTRGGKPNRTNEHDLGLGVAQLVLQAQAVGLHTHQMAGIDLDRIRTTYDIPDDFDPVAALALGYRAAPDRLAPDLAERERQPRGRKPLHELVFQDEWAHPADLVR